MNLSPEETEALATLIVIVLVFGMYWLVRWTKTKSPNTVVWGTIFESISHYVQPQASLKEPSQEIQKLKKDDGQRKNEAN